MISTSGTNHYLHLEYVGKSCHYSLLVTSTTYLGEHVLFCAIVSTWPLSVLLQVSISNSHDVNVLCGIIEGINAGQNRPTWLYTTEGIPSIHEPTNTVYI